MPTSYISLQGDWYRDDAEEGALRVYCIVNPPDHAFYHKVATPEEAYALINREADVQLTDPAVTSNVFGLQIYHAGQWEEWEDSSGYTIDESQEFED